MSNKAITSRPIKMWIDGKIFPIQTLSQTSKTSQKRRKGTDSKDSEQCESEEHYPFHEECLQLLNITQDNGKFITNIKVPPLYYIKMKNWPEFDVKKLSQSTEAEISLPKLGREDSITIQCDNKINLAKAASQIHSTIGQIRDQNLALQFTCIPCANQNIKERFENLKDEMLNLKNEIKGLHESVFISPLKLHVTIDVYALLDDSEKAEAIKALNDYKETLDKLLIETGPLILDIATLDCMKNNFKKADVIYANVKILNETEEHNLQKIVNGISEHFYHRGLAMRYQENVKLHMTIINTKYRKNAESPRRKTRRQSIDASQIMEKFKDYNFGQCNFDSVHLSHISLKGEDGFYKPLAVIKLNENEELPEESPITC